MVIRHGGLTSAERVKKAVEVCKDRCSPYCPYWTEDECRTLILIDCAEAIAERDERIAIMQESMETLEKRCNTLNALEQRCKTLEAQEQPKKVYDPRLCNNSPKAYKGFCPWCNSVITLIHGKFCDKCGKAVKWE